MYFTKDTNLFGKRLNIFRKCFSKPQWTHFKTYIHGLLLGEKGEKNIEDIASNILDGKHQSSLNRFLTKRKWSTRKVNALRLKKNLHNRKGGVMALDDVL
ncbi:MAG: transposase, partial [Thermoplasmatota archaeon]